MDFVTRVALPALQNGNIGYVNFLQRIFTIKEAKHYHIEVANVFVELLAHTSAKELIHLDEKCRYYNIYEGYTINWWDIDWYSLKLSREMLPICLMSNILLYCVLAPFIQMDIFARCVWKN